MLLCAAGLSLRLTERSKTCESLQKLQLKNKEVRVRSYPSLERKKSSINASFLLPDKENFGDGEERTFHPT